MKLNALYQNLRNLIKAAPATAEQISMEIFQEVKLQKQDLLSTRQLHITAQKQVKQQNV